MDESVQHVVDEISRWDGIAVEPHRFGGREFTLGKVEIGHIHNNGMVDIPFTRAIREQLVAEGHAELHHLLRDSGWISFYIRQGIDIDAALWLYRLSYIQKMRNRHRHSEERLAYLTEQLDNLQVSAELRALLKL